MVYKKTHILTDKTVDSELNSAAQEQDLDAVIDTKTSAQCSGAVPQAKKMLL